ncbi:MAG: ribose ABC transporter permease [Planctomycetota bacterium]|nr:MAG: ribose ABC transporter permease [Planctomycetota bacterium]
MPVILAALVVASTILTGGRFAQLDNLVNVARQISFEGLIAFGMTLVIVTGGIDLSVGSLVALCGVVGALVMRSMGESPPALAIATGLACGIAVGGAIGLSSGAIIARFAIPPFIVTLAAMLMARGFAFIACHGEPVYELPSRLMWLGRGFVGESVLGRMLPVPVLVLIVAYACFAVVLTRTVFGRQVIAVGSNEEAARLAGIAVRRTKLIVYVITGSLAGLTGVMHSAKLMAGDPKVGDMWELNVIAAVVVGGTSLFGGRGTMTGTLIGALLIGVLNNSLNLLQVEHFWQKVVLGGVILAASLIDAGLRRLDAR